MGAFFIDEVAISLNDSNEKLAVDYFNLYVYECV